MAGRREPRLGGGRLVSALAHTVERDLEVCELACDELQEEHERVVVQTLAHQHRLSEMASCSVSPSEPNGISLSKFERSRKRAISGVTSMSVAGRA